MLNLYTNKYRKEKVGFALWWGKCKHGEVSWLWWLGGVLSPGARERHMTKEVDQNLGKAISEGTLKGFLSWKPTNAGEVINW